MYEHTSEFESPRDFRKGKPDLSRGEDWSVKLPPKLSEIMGNIIEHPAVPVTCRGCGIQFMAEAVSMEGSNTRIQPNVCEACSSATKAVPSEEAERQRRANRWRDMVGCYYDDWNPKKLPAAMESHWQQALKWAPSHGKPGVGFIGPTHTAKSIVLHQLGRTLYVDGYDVFPTSGMEFQKFCLTQVQSRDVWDRYLERCERAKILLLDDADKLKLTDAVEAWYYGMLEARRKWMRPVLATVNVDGEAIAKAGSENRAPAIVSRLRDLCEFIQVP